MIKLLQIVKNINDGCIDEDLPPLKGGSREVQRVFYAFAKLYKIVRMANSAFFSRNLKWALHFVSDALELFRKVDDKKAVGIACNNAGNILFAMIREAHEENEENRYVSQAYAYYNEAVDNAQEDVDQFPSCCEDKANCALALSDRLFNRGLFLLHVDGDESLPADAREKGYKDIANARVLDNNVKNWWLDKRLLLKYSVEYFDRLIRRIKGLSELCDDVGLQQIWDVRELVDDADQLLFAAWNEPSAPLFREINRVGRLQQLEGAAMLLAMNNGNDCEAARLAMRIFSEDEFILDEAFVRAADALIRLTKGGSEEVSLSRKTSSCVRVDMRRMLKQCKNATLNIGKCLVFSIELFEHWEGSALLESLNFNCLRLYDRLCAPGDYMAVAADGTSDALSVELCPKDENEGRQRTALDIATQSSTGKSATGSIFPTAFQMVIDSPASVDHDSFIIVVTDGNACDVEACQSIISRIERLNKDRNSMIHVFVIGFDVQDANTRATFQNLCSVTKSSFYADAFVETIDKVFEAIAVAISGAASFRLEGITMQKF